MARVALQRGEELRPVDGHAPAFLNRARAGIPRSDCTGREGATRSIAMMDILMLGLGFGLFALAIGYTYACERL